MVQSVSGGCKHDSKFAVQSNKALDTSKPVFQRSLPAALASRWGSSSPGIHNLGSVRACDELSLSLSLSVCPQR